MSLLHDGDADPDALERDILHELTRTIGVSVEDARPRHWLNATALVLRGRMISKWHETNRRVVDERRKQVCYLSMEFLMARQLGNFILATGLDGSCRRALARHKIDLDDLLELEPDPALGNGGLGRLAACFMDSMAFLGIPAIGYGIRYEHGMFRQDIVDGWQVENPEDWLADHNPWEISRSEATYRVSFGGHVEHRDQRAHWVGTEDMLAVAHDVLIPAHNRRTVNTLRLWTARPAAALDVSMFNRGFYSEALAPRMRSDTITRLLYPDDSTAEGRQLRLRQEHFFVSASIQDVLSRFAHRSDDWGGLPSRFSLHLNDTHPALAPAELMRLLVDEHRVPWEQAWRITSQCFSYTNHTLLPEALEIWPVELLRRNVPRHLEIISEIDRRFRNSFHNQPSDHFPEGLKVLSDHGEPQVNMGRLCVLVSQRVNGVSALHSRLIKERLFPDFARLYPERFDGITNGISHRLWLYQANPALASLIDAELGPSWRDKLQLAPLVKLMDDANFVGRVRAVKRENKAKLADFIRERSGIMIDPEAMIDVHIKRIHEYKRQLLNILGVISRWDALRNERMAEVPPRVVVMAGKAASGYHLAKLIIKLANDVAHRINADSATRDRLKLIFLPNYNVSLAERIIPGADLSQQISLAGTEASGTGNMKLALNGALTLGTADGANLEIAEAAGASNIFLFGLKVGDVANLREQGYDPPGMLVRNSDLRRCIELLAQGEFSPDEPGRYLPLIDSLLRHGDRYMVLADFADYQRAQSEVDAAWMDQRRWARMALANIASMHGFSSDRSISQYADRIWRVLALHS